MAPSAPPGYAYVPMSTKHMYNFFSYLYFPLAFFSRKQCDCRLSAGENQTAFYQNFPIIESFFPAPFCNLHSMLQQLYSPICISISYVSFLLKSGTNTLICHLSSIPFPSNSCWQSSIMTLISSPLSHMVSTHTSEGPLPILVLLLLLYSPFLYRKPFPHHIRFCYAIPINFFVHNLPLVIFYNLFLSFLQKLKFRLFLSRTFLGAYSYFFINIMSLRIIIWFSLILLVLS